MIGGGRSTSWAHRMAALLVLSFLAVPMMAAGVLAWLSATARIDPPGIGLFMAIVAGSGVAALCLLALPAVLVARWLARRRARPNNQRPVGGMP